MGVTSEAFSDPITPPASRAAAASSEQKNLEKSSGLWVAQSKNGILSSASKADFIAWGISYSFLLWCRRKL
jgi:hypothetical protein